MNKFETATEFLLIMAFNSSEILGAYEVLIRFPQVKIIFTIMVSEIFGWIFEIIYSENSFKS
jgi:hypothetical protein